MTFAGVIPAGCAYASPLQLLPCYLDLNALANELSGRMSLNIAGTRTPGACVERRDGLREGNGPSDSSGEDGGSLRPMLLPNPSVAVLR